MDVFVGGGILVGIVSGVPGEITSAFLGAVAITCITLGIHAMTSVHSIPCWEHFRHWLWCLLLSEPTGKFVLRRKQELTMACILCVSAVCTWKAWTRKPVVTMDPPPSRVAIAVQHPDGYICLGV